MSTRPIDHDSTTPLDTMSDRLGCCPGCGLPAVVGDACPEAACRARGLHAIPAELEPGDEPEIGRLLDDYLVTGVLGEGGFGRVLRAISLADGDTVALKIAGADAMHAERLLREARALGRITHPNVVCLIGDGYCDGAPYLVLEYLDAHHSLADEITSRGERGDGFGEGEILAILSQVLDGLGAAHAHGVVHRDIKPENIMLKREGGALQVKILDFGLAKLRARGKRGHGARKLTPPAAKRTMALGTPTHMAPEQLEGRGLGPWTDLYAVGVIAFELLTGSLPFEGESASSVLRQRIDPHYDALGRAPELPEACRAMLARALARDPIERFRDVDAMRAALEGALMATPGPAPLSRRALPRPTSGMQPWNAVPRRARIFGAVAAAAPAFVGAFLALVAIISTLAGGAATAGPSAPSDDALSVMLDVPQAALRPLPELPRWAIDVAPADPLAEVVAHARTCAADASELALLASRCDQTAGCMPLTVRGDLARGLTLQGAPADAERLVLVVGAPAATNACGARTRRSRAIVGGAWDVIEPAWGSYVQPRVVVEAKLGKATQTRQVLVERGVAPTTAALEQVAVCLEPSELPTGTTLETFEELRFQAADTRRFGEEGKFPCRLDVLGAFAVTPPKRPDM